MKILCLNANGIRAAARKGFFDYVDNKNPDVICLQELKAQEDQLNDSVFNPLGYYRHMHCALKKGYSGVAIYSKEKPLKVTDKLGWDLADSEGRYIEIELAHLHIASIYLPSGSAKEQRQDLKLDFMARYYPILERQVKSNKPYIICGDFNIVHREIDIKNFKANQKNSGCRPEERAWIDQVFNHIGFIDSFRAINPEPHQYTWWSNRGQARQNNVGWRIDYQLASPQLKDKIKSSLIYKENFFSDHACLWLEIDV